MKKEKRKVKIRLFLKKKLSPNKKNKRNLN